jgi:exodeoxyribonuclease VII large subunit
MKKVLSHRYPMAKMILIPALVQGEGAKESIVRAIKKADQLAGASKNSIMIVGRGGGSIEDLWAFNEEIVADAVYTAQTPVISAVGHESDFVISDFVADVRASTPSNAIEISTPDINELRIYVDSLNDELNNRFKRYLNEKEQMLKYLYSSFSQHSLEKRFSLVGQSIEQLKKQFNNLFSQHLGSKKALLDNLKNSFHANDPKKKSKKGYVQVTKNNELVSVETLKKGDEVVLESPKYKLGCKIVSKEKI